MNKSTDKPDNNAFGQFISEVVQAFGITGAKAAEIYGGTPNGRTWAQIMDDGKDAQKNFPKGD